MRWRRVPPVPVLSPLFKLHVVVLGWAVVGPAFVDAAEVGVLDFPLVEKAGPRLGIARPSADGAHEGRDGLRFYSAAVRDVEPFAVLMQVMGGGVEQVVALEAFRKLGQRDALPAVALPSEYDIGR